MATIPFLLRPTGKDYLWGGSRLNEDFKKNIDMVPLAETWECSTHQDGPSYVASGEMEGMTLTDVLKAHPEYLGRRLSDKDGLPVLVKLIDAKENLSVQVHPTDEYAFLHEAGQHGKTEMWYVLDAKKDAQLVYGFAMDVTAEQVRESVADGTVEKYLQKIPVKRDDVFFIPSGTVHAIGRGVLLAEIQQSSNLTYRLYDYDRTDRWGQKRELHLEKALNVAKLSSSTTPRQPLRVLKYKSGYASELLTRCRYFQVERMLLNTENRKLADFQTEKNSFHALLCVDGCGVLYGDDVMLTFFKGDCIFVPAESIPLMLHGKAQILNVSC